MSLLSVKLCIALLMVGICALHISGAPTPTELAAHAINEPDAINLPPSSESDQHPITVEGTFNGEPVLSPLANSASTADHPAPSSSPAPAVLVRVRRNKHPIRYHDKSSVQRQL